MLERLTLPIEWKAEGGGSGSLVGYLSTWDVDLGGDRIERGAFKKAVQTIKKSGIPLLADHFAATSSVLGTIYDAAEDLKGLKITARFSAAPSAQDVRIKMVEGHLNRLSIGYESMEDHLEESADGRRIRVLTDVKLWEGSVVVFPMNPAAAITQAKSWVAGLPDDARAAVQDVFAADETKATANEVRDQLSVLLRERYAAERTYVWIRDWDESHVWFEIEGPATNGVFEHAYTLDAAGAVDLTGDRIEVRASVTYKPVNGSKVTTLNRGAKEELPPEGGATGGEPAADTGGEPVDSKDTAPGGEPGSASGEGAAGGWDRWKSEALLNGRDPEAIADPATVAGLGTRLALMESSVSGKEG